jgi:putative NADPH-quinone reductase
MAKAKKPKKKILIIDGHPGQKSHSELIAEEYQKGAKKAKFDVKMLIVRDLKFDPILHGSSANDQKLEKDLKEAQEKISWADHIVIVFPIWWGHMPALLKGFLDRTFISGFAFKFEKEKRLPEALLKGKSARIIYTQGAPRFYTRFVLRDSIYKAIKSNIFEFCGFSPIQRTYLHDMHYQKDAEFDKFLRKVFDLGLKGI